MSIEEAREPMTNLLATIEGEKDSYGTDDIENAISTLRNTFITYLGNIQPISPSQPIPASWLIENRGFDEDANGWTDGPASIKNGVAEFTETTFNTYQTLAQLPVGNYMLTLNAFQRPGSNQETYTDWMEGKNLVKAQLYAMGGGKSSYITIQNIWDGACVEKKEGTCAKQGELYVPNNTLAANSWFADSCYENQLPVELTKAATLKIGIRSSKSEASWWTCFDNFGLLFFGPYNAATGIEKLLPLNKNEDKTWYDLSGRKLSSKPKQKGIYIWGQRKVAIK